MGRWMAALAAAGFISVISYVTAFAGETANEGTWISNNLGWRYMLEQDVPAKKCWKQIDGYWYYFDTDGYMVTGWMRIKGARYFFWDSGDLAVGWCYNDENEKWYYFDEDGTAKKGWYQDENGSWYWFSNFGDMTMDGYKTIDGQRYYFFEDGQLAANQYVGMLYMDENGQRDKRYDIVLQGRAKESLVTSDLKVEITNALKDIPRGWIKYMVEHDWQIIYYPEREYFSAPVTDGDRYYVYHKLDTEYHKIKFCNPEGLTQALGELIGYESGSSQSGSQFATEFAKNHGNVDEFVDVPNYFLSDLQFYFGKLVEAYLDVEIRPVISADSPQLCQILHQILYQYDVVPQQ